MKDIILSKKITWEVPPGWREKQTKKLLRATRKIKLSKIFGDESR